MLVCIKLYQFMVEVLLWNNSDYLVFFFMVGDPTVENAVAAQKWCCEYV